MVTAGLSQERDQDRVAGDALRLRPPSHDAGVLAVQERTVMGKAEEELPPNGR
jgi:hypothetical protein